VNLAGLEDYDRIISSGLYDAAVSDRLLVPHEEVELASPNGAPKAYKILRPDQIPFISYPYEWCFSQLKDAALLTLRLQERALEHDLILRDASAYNVQFLLGRPIFIDSLSFGAYQEGKPWVAYRQFCEHFLAPLALMAYNHVDLLKLLRVNIDGIPLDLAAAVLPRRTKLRFSLLTHIHLHARAQKLHSDTRESAEKANASRVSRRGLMGLIDSLRSAVEKLEWNPSGTQWGDYYSDTNYSDRAREHKKQQISSFLDAVRPRSVWDLGANTGLFSRLASDREIRTIAFDADPAAVEKNYRAVRAGRETHLLPLLNDLTNPSPGIGWDNDERSSLFERGPADLVMALALVHHLAIGNNVPLDRIAGMLHRTGRQLVIEFVPKADSQVRRLLATREDIFPNYTQEGFEAAFGRCYTLKSRCTVHDTARSLYLFERK
jgi:hypothetical protein